MINYSELQQAIDARQTIRFRHQADKGIDHRVTFQPYGLYESTIWFTAGRVVEDGEIHVYALHNLSEIEFVNEHYSIPEGFNAKEYMTDFWVDTEEYPEFPDDGIELESYEATKGLDEMRRNSK